MGRRVRGCFDLAQAGRVLFLQTGLDSGITKLSCDPDPPGLLASLDH
jgi:hypothetical protein